MADPLSILDLRGGVNDSDVPIAIAQNEVADARNVDWFDGLLARKRNGTTAITLIDTLGGRPPKLDVTTGSQGAGASATLSFSHAGSSGLSPVLLVAICIGTPAAQTVTGVTYNAVAMTLVNSQADSGGSYALYLFTATALSSSATVVITASAATDIGAAAYTFINCSNVGVFKGTVAYAGGSNLRTTATGAGVSVGRDAVFSVFAANGGGYVGAGPGQRVCSKLTFPESLVASYEIDRVLTDAATHVSATVQHVQGSTADTAVLLWAALAGLTQSALAGAAGAAVVGLWRHTPTDDVTADELWALDEFGRFHRYVSGSWTRADVYNKYAGAFDDGVDRYYVNATSLHGKFFITAKSAPFGYDENFTTAITGAASPFTSALTPTYTKDRLLVWDGTGLRLSGIDAPRDALGAADSGGAGAMTGARAYRYRYIVRDSNNIVIRRSEPSAAVAFTPDAAHASVTVTKEAARTFYDVGSTIAAAFVKATNGETHWEVEEAVDWNTTLLTGTFYRIATVAIATLTYADSLTVAQVTADETLLSEAVGEYAPLRSARHVVVDDDRILVGATKDTNVLTGSVGTDDSAVSWTPVEADDGVGNDERVPATITTTINLDGKAGGNIRAMLSGEHGVVHVFKATRFYRLIRTGQDSDAYDPIAESRTYGALPNTATTGFDATGNVAIYAVDPTVGLYRLGANGLELLMDRKVRRTWRRRNTTADPVRLLSYRDRGQLWVWCALDAATVPDRLFVFDRRTSSFSYHDGNLAAILSCTLYPDSTGILRPFLGSSRVNAVQRADTGSSDDSTYYRGYVTTKQFLLGGLGRKFGLTGGVLHALAGTTTTVAVTSITRSVSTATVTTTTPHSLTTGDSVLVLGATQTDYNSPTDAAGFLTPFTVTVTGASTFTYPVANAPTTPATGTITVQRAVMVNVRIVKDYGKESAVNVPVSILPTTAAETRVTRLLNDLTASGLFAVQLEIGDPSTYAGIQLAQTWTLDALVAGVSLEENVIGG